MDRFREVYISLTPEALKFYNSDEYMHEYAIFKLSFAGEEKQYEVGLDCWMFAGGSKKLVVDHVADPSIPFGYLSKDEKPIVNRGGYYLYTIGLVNGGTVIAFTHKVELV